MPTDNQLPSIDDVGVVPSAEPLPLVLGEVFKADPNLWYNLRVTYTLRGDDNKKATGFLTPLAQNAATSFYEYMVLDSGWPATKFKILKPDPIGWSIWELENGEFLSLKATGWLYRSSAYPLGFQIVDNRLYNNYRGGTAGSAWKNGLVPSQYYTGVGCDEFICELVPIE